MSSQGVDLITAATQANYISTTLTSNVEYIASNIQSMSYETNAYIYYKFENSSNFICDSKSQKHLINNGGIYTSDGLLLTSNNYAVIPSENWNSYNDLTISGWFKTQNIQTSDKLLDISYTYPPNIVRFKKFYSDFTNLLAWWKFDDSITADSSLNNITLTYTAGTGLIDIDPSIKIIGNGSLVQKNSTLSTTNSSSTAFLSSTSTTLNLQTSTFRTSFSISFWVRISITTIRHVLFIWGNATTSSTNAQILGLISANGTLSFDFTNNGLNTASNTIIINTWYHVVFTYDTNSRNRQIYVNGALIVSDISASAPTCTSGNFRIGYTAAVAGLNFVGNLADFRVYNKVLSSTEINDLYNFYEIKNQTQKVPTDTLALYKFNNNYNDSSGNNYTLVPVGSFSFDSVNLKTNDYSISQTTAVGSQTANTLYLENTSINLTNISFSIAFWIKISLPDTTTTFRIITFGDVGTAGNMILIGWFGTYFRFSFYTDDLDSPSYSTTQINNDINKRWVHLCFTFNNATKFREIYVNGNRVKYGISLYNPNVSSKFRIGHAPTVTSGTLTYQPAFIGNLDDLRIYNRILTQDEISALNTSEYNMTIVRKNIQMSFQINNTPIYEPVIIDNTWNHFIWNIKNSKSNQGYIQINNDDKTYFNKQSLTPISTQYPPYPMTNYDNTFNGYTYRATAYNSDAAAAWRAFDYNNNTDYGTNLLNASSGLSGATFGSDTYQGIYLAIDMGQAIVLDYYEIWRIWWVGALLQARRPKNWRIYATNNDACWIGGATNGLNTGPGYGWVNIDERANETTYTDTTNFYVNKTIPYRYYAMQVNALIDTGTSTRFHIAEWVLFGYNPDNIIQQYPLVPMTGFTTVYNNIVYRACAYNYSTPDQLVPWKAFDRSFTNSTRYVSSSSFDINGVLNITGVSFGNDTNYKGVYLGIDMGQMIIMKYYYIIGTPSVLGRRPRNWKIYATNDDRCWNETEGTNGTPCFNTDAIYNWQQIDIRTQETTKSSDAVFTLDNTTPYRYYALHVNALIGDDTYGSYFDIYEWKIFGYSYYAFTNTLGSSTNQGTIIVKDFKIHTTDENKLYYIADLINNNGVYTLDYTNSIILPPSNQLSFTSTNWNILGDLTVSGWFKTEGFSNGDKILELTYNNIENIQTIFNNTSDMIAWYKFDDINTYLQNSVGTGSTLTPTLTPTNISFDSINKKVGNGAINFISSTSAIVTATGINYLDNNNQVSSLSVSFWLRLTMSSGSTVYRVFALGTANDFFINITWNTTVFRFIGGSFNIPTASLNYLSNVKDKWFHFAFVYDSSLYSPSVANNCMFCYVNGSLLSPIATTTLPSSASNGNLYIGNGIMSSLGFEGQIDDLRIYKKALTSQQVNDIYNIKEFYNIISDLEGWYKFENNFNDSSGKNRTLTTTSSPSFDTVNPKINIASVNFIAAANNLATSAISVSNISFTIAFWIRPTSTGQIISQGNSGGTRQFLHLNIQRNASNAIFLRMGFYFDDLDTPGFPENQIFNIWTHYVFRFDNTSRAMFIYRNGVAIASKTAGGTTSFGGNFRIGYDSTFGSSFLGMMDDLRIYYRPLRDGEIDNLYNNIITYNIRNNTNQLSFEINNTSVYQTAYPLNNTWNHIIWNISSATNSQGFIRINNGAKINVNKPTNTIPLTRYPPTAMTNGVMNFTGYGYNSGTYITSASSIYAPPETHFYAFNYGNEMWTTTPYGYSSTTGAYLGTISTVISGTTVLGEWLQIQLPIPVILNNYNIYTHSTDLTRGPKEFRIAGSNDGITWTLVNSQTNITGYTASGKSFTISSNTKAYTYYRIVILSNNNNVYVSIQEWEIYGYPLYPFTNILGSTLNSGRLFISDFKVITNSITTTLENQLYATLPDDGTIMNRYLTYENIRITSNEFRIYNPDYVKDYPYLQYEFKSPQELPTDSSSNLRLLSNYGGTYSQDNGINSIVLKNGTEAQFPTENWSIYTDLTISTWFKTNSFNTNDELLDFYEDPSSYIQIEQYVKYPLEAMTSDTTTSTTTGVVTRTKATTVNLSYGLPFNLFNFNILDEHTSSYHTAGNYTSSTGVATTTYFTGYAGEAILIDLGVNIILKQVRFYPRLDTILMRSPGIFRIYATNNVTIFDTPNYTSSDWAIIHNQTTRLTTSDYIYGQPTVVNINNNNSYRIYALVVNTLSGSGTNASILNFAEWELYGTEITPTVSQITPVQLSGGDYYYAFTNTNIVYNMNVSQDINCDMLLVGGGGGGGGYGGGGGGGDVIIRYSYKIDSGSYIINIGKGGLGGTATAGNGATATSGLNGETTSFLNINNVIITNSIYNALYAAGGGGGTGYQKAATITPTAGNILFGNYSSGGGGGSASDQAVNIFGSGNNVSGNGGNNSSTYGSGGGGGAVGNGTNGTSSASGNGGIGQESSITGSYLTYGGGGGGGSWTTPVSGKGTDGGADPLVAGSVGIPNPAVANRGGGGAGGSSAGGGNGGSGIVIIRFNNSIKISENANNQLTLYTNNKNNYITSNISDNQWNHMLWNITNNGTPYGFVKINNKDKTFLNTPSPILLKYPRQAATANTYAYTDGTIVRIGGSGQYDTTESFIAAFNYNTTDAGWGSLSSSYTSGVGTALRTYRTGYAGEYVQIDLGEAIVLNSYYIYPRSANNTTLGHAPNTFRLYASNNSSAWTDINHPSWILIDDEVNISAYTTNTPKIFSINNSNAYRYFVIIINKTYTTGDTMAQIAELEFYGYSATNYNFPLNPVIHYQFTENPTSASIAYDSTIFNNKYNMTIVRAGTAITTQTTGYTANSYLYTNAFYWNGNTASTADNVHLTYNGHNSYIQALLNQFHNNYGFSIHFVFRTENITSTSQILYIGNTPSNLIRIYVINSVLYFTVANAEITYTIATSTYYVIDCTVSISANRNTMTLNMFVENVLQTTVTSAYQNNLNNVSLTGLVYYIGRSATDATNDATPARIQDFRVFNYPLNRPEIAALQSGAISYPSNGIYPGSYINKLGSLANLGDLYLSDFRIITDPITSELEDRLYNKPTEYVVVSDEDTITNTLTNISALYYQGSKKLETNATGVAVKGNITATGNVLSYYSDMRLKEIVSEIENPMEKIMNINTFKYTPNQLALSMGVQNSNIEVGVCAQDVNEVLPEIVSLAPCDRTILDSGEIISKSGENYMTVSYPQMVPLLIECIKELNEEIEKL